MTNIRRYHIPDTPVFNTVVCHGRKPVLAPSTEKERLLAIMHEVKVQHPFVIHGYAILHDHFHCLIKPVGRENISCIIQSVKLRFTHRFKQVHGITKPMTLWQRRFWDHIIRDRNDFRQHLDYIHYNPVKHGYVDDTSDYLWSSYHTYFERGYYPPNWSKIESPLLTGTEFE